MLIHSRKQDSTIMMRLWIVTLVVCLLASSIEGRKSLRRNLQDSPTASPTNQDGEPVDVFVDVAPAAAPTPDAPTADNGYDSPTVGDGGADDGGDGGVDQNTGDGLDGSTQPDNPAPTVGNGGDTTEGGGAVDANPETTSAGGDTGDNNTEGGGGDVSTQAPDDGSNVETTPAVDAGNEGDGTEDVIPESTASPSMASGGDVVPEPTQAPVESAPTPAPVPDTIDSPTADSPTDGGGGDEYDWENYTPPTEQPVVYVPPDENGDPVKNEANTTGAWMKDGESPEQMMHDRNVLIAASVLCSVGILLMIITAHQMVENPDGCCAGVCRLIVGCTCCIFRTICFPCRACCGGGGRKRRGRQHQMLDNGNYTHDLELS